MTNPVSYLIQGQNIILVIDNKPYTITNSHISYDKIKNAIKNKDWDSIAGLVNASTALKTYGKSEFEVVDGNFYRNGQVVHSIIADRIVTMYQEGFDIQPMVKFMQNLEKNPSKRAVDEFYKFLEFANLPITEDGCFLAYKKVQGDYLDCHSRSVLNKPHSLMTDTEIGQFPKKCGRNNEVLVQIKNGATNISMERNMVDDVASRTCSNGLHFCSYDYLKSFGGSRVVILKINPANVVSIPTDYSFTKGRCSEYDVVGEVSDINNPQTYFKSTIVESTAKPRKNSRGQWIDANGKFLAKHLIPKN